MNMKYVPAKIYVCILACWTLCSGIVPAAVTNAAAVTQVEKSTSLWGVFKTGGPLMWPLLILSMLVVALAITDGIILLRKRWFKAELEETLAGLLRVRKVRSAISTCEQQTLVVTRALVPGLRLARSDAEKYNRPAMDGALEESISKEYFGCLPKIQYLSIIATIAPMLGLLGTVSGMIKAFQKIGIQGMGEPQALAGNIGEALITTAFGLIVGIPAMFFFFYYRNMLRDKVEELQEKINFLVGQLTGDTIIEEDMIPEE
jgi:biopolymer transport protein ExbB